MNKERRDVTRDYYHLNFRAIFHVTKQQQKIKMSIKITEVLLVEK